MVISASWYINLGSDRVSCLHFDSTNLRRKPEMFTTPELTIYANNNNERCAPRWVYWLFSGSAHRHLARPITTRQNYSFPSHWNAEIRPSVCRICKLFLRMNVRAVAESNYFDRVIQSRAAHTCRLKGQFFGTAYEFAQCGMHDARNRIFVRIVDSLCRRY